MSDWVKVGYYLYKGLSDYLDKCIKAKQVDQDELEELKECVDIYAKNCVITSDILKNKIKELEYFKE